MIQEKKPFAESRRVEVDELDRQILDLLVEDGRRSVVDIGQHIKLSPAATKRRVDRLESKSRFCL